jgi:uncharacterized protein
MQDVNTPLTDAEFDELDGVLARRGEEAMPIEGLDGFFAALACSPVLARPSEWMPVVWRGEMPEWDSLEEVQRAIGLLMRFWNQVVRTIDDGSFAPVLTTGINQEGEEVVLPHAWCLGFREGMDQHREHWFDDTQEELQEILFPTKAAIADALVRLGEVEESKLRRLTPEEIDGINDEIPEMVLDLRAYWQKHPVAPSPASSTRGPKVGRNAPCPCGSGKKFKHCHGSGESEH